MRATNTTGETTLYRHYDKDGILLYIGISSDVLNRTCMHKRSAFWYRQIETIKVTHFATRKEAENAERLAIVKENPAYNEMLSTSLLLPIKKVERWHDGIRPRGRVTITYPE